MPKRGRSRRTSPARVVALLVVAVLAVLVGRQLFAPAPQRTLPRRSQPTPASTASAPAAAATPANTPSPRQSATPTLLPSATPTVVPTVATPPSTNATLAPNGPKLAIVIDDCGQWIDTERAFIALPVPLTLSVLPDVRYTATVAREAAAAGKGVMLHLPMSTVSGLNPGPGKITTTMSDAQIEAQVAADLAQIPEAHGVNNHEGSRATSDPRVMGAVMRALVAHGNLFFIDSRTIATTVGERTARADGLPSAARDVFLDDRANVADIEAQLRLAATIARTRGQAIAIGHPRPTTLAAVRAMLPELQREGIHLVLARDLVTTAS